VKEPFGHEEKQKKKGNEHGVNHGFFWANVRNLATKKKKRLENPTKGFLRLKKNNSPYLDKKNLEVARFRHCVSEGCQS
jgi:hypothetical protein